MRIVKEINRNEFKVTIFSWNQKYLIKLEQGDLEQTYKVSELDLLSEGDLEGILTDEFYKDVQQIFISMNKCFDQHADL